MKSIRLKKVIAVFLLLMTSVCSWAEAAQNEVVIQIATDKMTADKVEKSIADPIEVLMGNLEDVLLISAKYKDNEAEISVKFNKNIGKQNLVERVRLALDKMTSMPDHIISLSVSLAGEPQALGEPANKIRPAQPRSFEGSYLGDIQSSNEFVPVMTSFFKSDDRWGEVSTGRYQMSEVKSVVTGQLSSCLAREDYLVNCRWKDKYGQGDVSFQFTDDFARFKAVWRIDNLQGEFKWNGAKVQMNPE